MLTLQFIDLEFKLPYEMVGRVIVMGGDSNLALSRSAEGGDRIIVFRTVNEFNETYKFFREKDYFEGMDIHDAESFFDALARIPDEADSEALKTMRQTMQIDDSVYSKTSNGRFVVYRLTAKQPAGQVVYILVDGQEMIYEMAGHISDSDFNALLSGMALSSVH